MEEFDYSKCTYEELNAMLRRFKNKSLVFRNKKYNELAKDECFEIVRVLNEGRYINAKEIISAYEKEYIEYYSGFNLEELGMHYRLVVQHITENKSIQIKCIESRIEGLKKKERIKESNKGRFLLKGRV